MTVRGKKYILICNEPAKNEDYACNQCGGDIRDTKCCTAEHCTKYEIEESK